MAMGLATGFDLHFASTFEIGLDSLALVSLDSRRLGPNTGNPEESILHRDQLIVQTRESLQTATSTCSPDPDCSASNMAMSFDVV